MEGGDCNGGCIELEIGGEQLIYRGKNRDRVARSNGGGTGRVRLDGRNQGDPLARCFELTVDTEVIAAESSGPGNGDTQDGRACYWPAPKPDPGAAPFPSTAFRHRL